MDGPCRLGRFCKWRAKARRYITSKLPDIPFPGGVKPGGSLKMSIFGQVGFSTLDSLEYSEICFKALDQV